jgi:hypothetical protein
MGQEIHQQHFSEKDMAEFQKRLRDETKILKSWFDKDIFSKNSPMTGIELEAWLVDNDMLPDPVGEEFLKSLNDKQVVPEISRFNFEINSDPYDMTGKVLSTLQSELNTIWKKCENHAKDMNSNALMMGTLATLRPNMLSLEYLSPNNRYSVMNQQVMNFRHGKPMKIKLEGKDELELEMDSVIAECAATSLQIHMGVTQENAKRYYNASVISSAFVTALSANSPYFFGKELWDESRIMTFEQAVEMNSYRGKGGKNITRVTLGNDYVHNSMLELFLENLDGYPVLLPEVHEGPAEDLSHLQLHNGTIWRWTRPIIGIEKNGNHHLRIEQRTPSAGPTVHDSIANTAFFLGLCDYLATLETPPEDQLSFEDNRDNFYKAAKQSLYCRVKWTDGKLHDINELITNKLLPGVKQCLEKRGFDKEDLEFYIDHIIGGRLKKGINGARWQKAWIHSHGKRFQELMEVYLKNQASGTPVHEWKI